MRQISRTEADEIRKTVAGASQVPLTELVRARRVCDETGAVKTGEILGRHIQARTNNGNSFFRMILAGLISGSVVALTFGRRR